jgi:leader peptidase (prepilin peptidase)/N-methyltransferase
VLVNPALLAAAPAALAAAATALAAGPLLRRLPEPDPSQPDAATKIRYAVLADHRFAIGCGLLSLGLGWTSWALLPPVQQPPWIVLATLGVLLAAIDLRTTWLPLRLIRPGWLLMLLAVALSAALLGDVWVLVRGLAGAVAAGALFAAVWAVSRGGFGFGDVRYALLIGAAPATVGWTEWIWALLLGSVAGAVVGLVRLMGGRRQGFPYAPTMLLGCYLALAWSVVV